MTGTFKRDMLTGLVMLLSLAGLVVTLWLFGEVRNFWETYYSIHLRMNEAGGLSSASPVSLNGLRIGSVLEAKVLDDPTQGVELTLRVKQTQKIPDNFTVYIDKSFVGETTLALEIPPHTPGAPPASFIEPGKTYTRTAKTFFALVADQVKAPLEKVGAMADDVHRLADVYESVGRNAAAFLEPRTPQQVEGGAAPNLSSTVARIDAAISNANKWLGNDATRTDFGTIMQRGASAAAKFEDTIDTFRKTSDEARTSISQVSAKLGIAAEDASSSLRRLGAASDEVRDFAVGINQGKGTLGQLAQNPDLYNNAKDAAARLERAISDFQLLLEKYRTEGLKLQF